MYVRKKKLSPFISGAKCQGFGSVEDIFPSKPAPAEEVPPDPECFGKDLIDAETGEPIELLKVRWNVKEGRLNLDTATILAMGTGRLDIKSRAKERDSPSRIETPNIPSVQSPTPRQISTAGSNRELFLFSSPSKLRQTSWDGTLITGEEESRPGTALSTTSSANQRISAPASPMSRGSVPATASTTGTAPPSPRPLHMSFADFGFDSSLPHAHRRHPLISQYLKSGPAKPMHHIHWDARTNSVRTTDEGGNPIDLTEDDVEFSSEEEEGGGVAEDELVSPERLRAGSRMSGMDSANSSVSSHTDAQAQSKGAGRRGRRGRAGSSVGGGVSVGGSTHMSSVGSGSKVSKTSKTSKRSGGVTLDGNRDTTLGLVDDAIVVSNKHNWRAIEERLFQELYALAWDYEHNKSLTLEDGETGGLAQIRQNARAIARLKTKGLRELVQASADEKVKEGKRAALEAENQSKHSYLAELQRVHEDERKKSRRYLHALEQDQEIVLIRKMADLGWLW